MWLYRRIRCRACEPCLRSDCGVCINCKDMKKFGGAGRRKQTCISRHCLAPLLPHNAVCQKCGQGNQPSSDGGSYDTFLLECSICFNIMHPKCLKELNPRLSHCGIIDEDYPNSWECGKCCEAGKEGQRKHRFNRSSSVLLCEEYVQTSAPLTSLLHSSEFETLSGDMSLDGSLNSVEEDLTLIAAEKNNKSEETKCMTKKGKCRQIEHYDTNLKRKKGSPLNPIICLEKMTESETCNGLELQSTSVQPIDALSHQSKKKKFSSHPCWHASLFSICSSASSFPSKPSWVNSRGREIMTPRRFLQ